MSGQLLHLGHHLVAWIWYNTDTHQLGRTVARVLTHETMRMVSWSAMKVVL